MTTLNKIQFILVAAFVAFSAYSIVTEPLAPQYPFISHDKALMICDDLGLVYNYEAEGYDAEDFCVMTEAQAE